MTEVNLIKFNEIKNSKDVIEANNRKKAADTAESNQNSIDANIRNKDTSGRVTGRVNRFGKLPINVRETTPWGSTKETRGRKPGTSGRINGSSFRSGKRVKQPDGSWKIEWSDGK